ncbi:MAG: hypothetical protein QOH69_221 [Actinomycetota bacterium]|jgi:hypothetical protein|nr:hypothetical protein [Actinomycetota bacterium]
MLTKSFVLVVVVIGVLVSIGGSWGVATLASNHPATAVTATHSGTPGHAGSDRAAGADGKNGAAGVNGSGGATGASGHAGSQGTAGAQGTAGTQGPAGTQGTPGSTGPSGASAPTFSAISANGIATSFPFFAPFAFATQTAVVPAGPALVGFSVDLQDQFVPFPVTCSLVDAGDPTNVFATTASQDVAGPPSYTTFATTQVVNLLAPTSLTVQCVDSPYDPRQMVYQSLSVYAISFAP